MDKVLRSIEDELVLYKSRQNVTEDAIAMALGITRQALSLKRHGETPFKLSEILDLCKLCGCDPNTLLGWKSQREEI